MIFKVSRRGKLHEANSVPNQDYICCQYRDDIAVISLSDGVSSCSKSKEGAELAGTVITQLFAKKGKSIMNYENDEISSIALFHVLGELNKRAKDECHKVDEYSSTLASVYYDFKKKHILCYNLGDSIIFTITGNEYRIVAAPFYSEYGCCVTTTKNANVSSTVRKLSSENIESIVICSDGAWRHMFEGNEMKNEILEMVTEKDFPRLAMFLDNKNCVDDYSFVALCTDRGSFS